MRYNEVRVCDINNGPGLMVTLWTQGCNIGCKGCHNKHLQDYSGGKEFTDSTKKYILSELNSIQNLGILGGEPLSACNIPSLTDLLKSVKEEYPNKEIWMWTGYDYEDVMHYELMSYVDVLIDGKFDESKKSDNLRWRGSSNQRVIDIQSSRKLNEVIIIDVDSRKEEGGTYNA